MEFLKTTLDNGLTIIGERTPKSASMALGFFARTGSRDENDSIHGVSHFLEHMMFKGTPRRSAMEVNLEFDRMGANYNAFTSEENTVYYAAVLPEFQARAVDLLGDILRPALREDDFETEKNVILEEIALYDDRPEFRLYEMLMQRHFNDHPLGRTILGTPDSIRAMKRDDMLEYFNRRYSPSNMIVVVTGNFDWESLTEQAAELCGKWQRFDTSRDLSSHTVKTGIYNVCDPKLQRMHIGQAAFAPDSQSEHRYAAQISASILGDSESGRLYYALVEPAIADEAAIMYDAMDRAGAMITFISAGADRHDEIMKIVREQIDKFQTDGPDEHELQAAKNKLASSAVISGEAPMGRLTAVGFEWLYRDCYTPLAAQIDELMSVTAEQVVQVTRDCALLETTTVTLGPDTRDTRNTRDNTHPTPNNPAAHDDKG